MVSKHLFARTDLHDRERHAEREKKVGKGERGRGRKGEAGRQEGDIHSICHLWDSQACAQRPMLSHLIELSTGLQGE